MKLVLILTSLLASSAFATEKMATSLPKPTAASAVAPVAVSSNTMAVNTLAFNFASLAQGKTNVYFDVGGLSERVSPSLSYRSYSNKEKRPKLNNAEFTVDRSLATLGASVLVFKQDTRSIVLSPYVFFGTEKDPLNTDNRTGLGARLVGQMALNKSVALQAGLDANAMEDEVFKGEAYIGMGFAL